MKRSKGIVKSEPGYTTHGGEIAKVISSSSRNTHHRSHTLTVEFHLLSITAHLTPVSETATLDAQVLLASILGVNRAWVLAHPDVKITGEQDHALASALVRLEAGEPLPYVLGSWEFFGLDFEVGPGVLIPRPETELVVERALGWLREKPRRRLGVDVGTGSGCIAISLTANTPDLTMVACDISAGALALADNNRRRHGVSSRVHLVQSDLLSPFPHTPHRSPRFDLVCANLPYIPSQTLESLEVSKHEPWDALHGGRDGLDEIRELLRTVPGQVAPGGILLLEIEASLGEAVKALASNAFPAAQVQVLTDLAGHDRLVVVETA